MTATTVATKRFAKALLHAGALPDKLEEARYNKRLMRNLALLINGPRSLDRLNFSYRARRIMRSIGIQTIDDLVLRSPKDLQSVAGCGKTTMAEIREKLSHLGLYLAGDAPVIVQDLRIAVRTQHVLQQYFGIRGTDPVERVAALTEKRLLETQRLSERLLHELRDELRAIGMDLAQE